VTESARVRPVRCLENLLSLERVKELAKRARARVVPETEDMLSMEMAESARLE
jgi:hypothetical protein